MSEQISPNINKGLPEKEQVKSRPNRREFLKILGLGTGGLTFLTASSATAGSLGKILEVLATTKIKGAFEKEETKNLQTRLLNETREQNKTLRLTLPEHPRFLLENVHTTIGGHSYLWRGGIQGNEIITGILQNNLQEVFESAEVVSAAKVRQESAERREMRENAEVDQSTVPQSGTIKREDFELDLSCDYMVSQKDLEAYFTKLGMNYSFRGFKLEKNKMLVINKLTIRDATTQTQHSLIAFGGEVDYNRTQLSEVIRRNGIQIRETVNKQEESYYETMINAFDNLKKVLSELKQSGSIAIAPRQ